MDVSDLSVKQLLRLASKLEAKADKLPSSGENGADDLRREAQSLRDLAAEKDQWQ